MDSLPLPVCQFARASRCRRFRGEAAFGKDTLVRQTFYGFRSLALHVRLAWPGVITCFSLAPAHVHELAVVTDVSQQTQGWLVGDRNYWSPRLRRDLACAGLAVLAVLAPYRAAKRDPPPRWRARRSRVRYRIDTVLIRSGLSVANSSSARRSSGSGHAIAGISAIVCDASSCCTPGPSCSIWR